MAMRPLDRLPSIRAKLGSVIVFAVAATILIMYVTVGFALRKYERDHELRQLVVEERVVATLAFKADGTPSKSLRSVVARVSHSNPVAVVDANGVRIAGSFDPPASAHQVLTDGATDTGTASGMEYLGVAVTRSGRVVGAVYIAQRVGGGGILGAADSTLQFVRQVWWQLLLAGAISAFIALAAARVLARGLTQPIRDMAAAAQRLARGQYGERVHVGSRDELGRLAHSFNTMARDLENLERLRRDLVANVSHELKTPISALRAHLENLLDGVEQPSADTLAVMLDQSERLGRLVEQLLDLSRLESGAVHLELEPVRLGPLVRQVAREIALSRPDGTVEFRNLVSEDLAPVLADRERVHQVLFNLLDNAFRFTPAGGSVTVSAVREDVTCEVSVEDTGPGIPEDHLPFVFERFYRVDAGRARGDGGTGIGLTIARSVVEAHGGRIWAESRPGGGTRFRFVLPLAVGAVADGGGSSQAALRVKEGV